jgi:predicted nucleic acid-binding Zn ribbon protein
MPSPDEPEQQRAGDRVSRAREALAAARAQAEARGGRRTRRDRSPADRGDLAGGRKGDGPVPAPGKAGTTPAGDGPASGGPASGGLTSAGPVSGSPAARGAPGSRRRRGAARPGFPADQQREDPQPLSAAIGGLLEAEGWALAAATGSVFGRWAQIVGADLAAHTTPEALTDGELTVTADSTAWATQVRLLAAQLVRRLNAELGDGTVLRVRVRGPVTSTRKPGEWRVRGSRGPRDTYG